MAIFLRVTHGPLKDQEFDIFAGLRMGREEGNIVLEDPKASARHAIVKRTFSGRYILLDQKSKNGIKVEGKRVDKVSLEAGVSFHIGDNVFLVVEEPEKNDISSSISEDSPEASDPFEEIDTQNTASSHSGVTATEVNSANDSATERKKPEPAVSVRSAQASPKADASESDDRKTWSQILEDYCRKITPHIADHPKALLPFKQTLILTFFRGLQAETEWELGYGPRTAGKRSMDLPIHDPQAPEGDCFTVVPRDNDVVFTTQHPEQIRVNGQALEKATLKAGDVISIYETQIEVSLSQ